MLRPEDLRDTGGRLYVPPTFSVVISSTFKPDMYEQRLADALPSMERLQPVELYELSDAARAAELQARLPLPSNTGPLAGPLADWGGQYSVVPSRTRADAPKAGQLQGDRMSLLESN